MPPAQLFRGSSWGLMYSRLIGPAADGAAYDIDGGEAGLPDLAEGEAVGLGPGIEEGDLKGAAGDGAGLTDELVHPLLGEGAVAVGADVGPVSGAGWLPVDDDAEPHRACRCGWSHDEVEVTAVEAAGDLPVRRV